MKPFVTPLRAVLLAVGGTLFIASSAASGVPLRIELSRTSDALSVYRQGTDQPILTLHARPDFRPYLHPIVAPDGRGVVTQDRPPHHPHQTGLYWGFTRVNDRDYFHHPGGDYWRRVSVKVVQPTSLGDHGSVGWETVYDLLDEQGQTLLTETQVWNLRDEASRYVLELQWTGTARRDLTIGKYDYGGLFLRMPWREGLPAEVVNAARQKNLKAEGQRAPWIDLGMQVEGRDRPVHVAILDHPQNRGFPQPWRVDQQYGLGPAPLRLGDWKLAAGEEVLLKYQLRIDTDPLSDVQLTAAWSKFSGEQYAWTLWRLAQQEGRDAKFLTPHEAVGAMHVPEGFQVNLYASEPMITQPMAFCWDDRGRLWVAENRDYENRNTGFASSGDSRIVILEDTDRDGVADQRKVFLDGIPFPAGIAVGFGGLWLGAPPNLLFVPDRDGDDRADQEDIEVRLTGWGIDDRHETINSLHWGPDGWLYGCQGFATNSRVGKPAQRQYTRPADQQFPDPLQYDGPTTQINGGVWRYHPTKERFEVVAHGFSNPWGIDYDAKGQLFITACVIPHLWHVIPGGVYHRQGGQHFNPYVYQDIRTIADHRHRSAHGGARIYLSDAFPKEYRGQIFMANIHEHAVLADVLEPRGSGFVGHHGSDFLLANNAQWVGFGIEIAPDGSLLVLDWHDGNICGSDVLNKETGRVFRIAPTDSRAASWPGRYADLGQMTDAQLAALQLRDSGWHARRARLLLQSRASHRPLEADAVAGLRDTYDSHANIDYRLRAMWALHATGQLSAPQLLQALEDPEPYVRAWAIQLLCEDRAPPREALERFAALAANDPSPVVRLYLAAALQRMELAERWAIARQLVRHNSDATDHNLPHMIWFGIEPAVPTDPSQALELASVSRIPLVARHIARRLADADQLDAVAQAAAESIAVRESLLLGLRDALDGRFDVPAPASWNRVYRVLQSAGGKTAALALELAGQFGDTQAAATMLATVASQDASLVERRQAIRELSRRKHPQLQPLLVDLLGDSSLRRDAIRAAAAYQDAALARELLDRYHSFTADEKLDAVHSLAARSSWGRLLTQAIDQGKVPRSDIPAYVARLLRRMVGAQFSEVWGPIDQLDADRESQFARYGQLLSAEALGAASRQAGEEVFGRSCQTCHKLGGRGGDIGPELTGANRSNLEYLLGNILTPSAVIQDAYRMQIVLTDEGRVYSGILAGENEHQIQLRVPDLPQPVVIAKSAIESRETASVSMMPDGLLANLTDEQVRDLFAYLMSDFSE
jgi:putative membrane-bound dehydrogenase-like protein